MEQAQRLADNMSAVDAHLAVEKLVKELHPELSSKQVVTIAYNISGPVLDLVEQAGVTCRNGYAYRKSMVKSDCANVEQTQNLRRAVQTVAAVTST